MMQLAMIPVFVSDQQRAVEFYRDKLGFEVIMDNSYAEYGAEELRWITVAPQRGGPQLILYHPGMFPSGSDTLEKRVGTWTGIVFYTDDIRETYQTLLDRGVEFEAEPSKQPWGGWETWFFDPDGNRFHLGQLPEGVPG